MRVLVALSGGVDSSVAAAEVLRAGHEVVGVTLRLWGGASDSGCCSVSDVEDARRAAGQLGIEHHVFNYSDEFDAAVVVPYVDAHAAGRTPNPCIECNRHLKFDALLRRAEVLGFDALATGHHARVVDDAGVHRVARGADPAKDQSYVLYTQTDDQLRRVLFPIGHLTKAQVRAEATALGLRTADKAESQDVCFITRADGRAAFLSERIELHPAVVTDVEGREVGRTDAVELVTIGQRKGLALSGATDRRFVVDVDVPGRTVTVGGVDDLLCDGVELASVVWNGAPVSGGVTAQTSAHGEPVGATVEASVMGRTVLRWSEPRRRVAPGQSVVVYRGDLVLGGGIVAE